MVRSAVVAVLLLVAFTLGVPALILAWRPFPDAPAYDPQLVAGALFLERVEYERQPPALCHRGQPPPGTASSDTCADFGVVQRPWALPYVGVLLLPVVAAGALVRPAG